MISVYRAIHGRNFKKENMVVVMFAFVKVSVNANDHLSGKS
jgi:hypothetical protein